MLTLTQLVEILRQTQLISPIHLNRLDRLAQAAPKEFTSRTALRWLINQEQLTVRQAERLVMQHDPDLAASLTEMVQDEPLALEPDLPQPRNLATSPQIPVRTPWSKPHDPTGPVTAPQAPAVSNSPNSTTGAGPRVPAVVPVAEQVVNVEPPTSRGLLDDLLDDPSVASQLTAPSATPLLGATGANKRVAGKWDSPLMLIGGGSLLLMLIVGVVLWFTLSRQSGDEILKQAEDDYRAGAYAQAIFKYERFIESYPKHARTSYARVQRATARLRQTIETTQDSPTALNTAESLLNEISSEPSFSDARPELASLLPAIAERAARAAVEHPDDVHIQTAQKGFELATKPQYVPEALRPAAKFQEIEQLLRLAERKQGRQHELEKAVTEITAAGNAGDFTGGFERHATLLRSFPDLRAEPKLAEAMASLASGLKNAVKFAALDIPAATDDITEVIKHRVTPVHYALAPAKTGASPAENNNEIAIISIQGALYGLEATTGRVAWRRSIGQPGSFVRVTAGDKGDALALDSQLNELVRVDSRTGNIRWRAKLGQAAVAPPLVVRTQIFLATAGGELLQLDLERGVTTGRWHLPQPIGATPAIDVRERLIYVLAEHTNLYVLSVDERRCVEVLQLGHAAGMVQTPLIVNGRFLFAAENHGQDGGLLRVVSSNADGLSLKPLESQLYRGHVVTPVVAEGRTMVMVNDRGAISVFEVAITDQGAPLKKIAELAGDDRPPWARYLRMVGGQLVVSGYDVTVNEVQVARGRISRSWSSGTAEPVTSAAQSIAGRIIFARRSDTYASTIVEGVDPASGPARWQTHLATTPVGCDISSEDKSMRVVLADGGVVRTPITPSKPQEIVTYQRPANITQPLLPGVLPLDDHRVLALRNAEVSSNRQQLVTLNSTSTVPELAVVRPAVTALPTVFGTRLLVPVIGGEIEPLKPNDLAREGEPFQPRLEPGVEYRWSQAAVADAESFVVSDRRTKLYRIGVKAQPRTHLAELASAEVVEPLESLAVAGDTVYGLDRSGRLNAFALSDLKPGQQWKLGAAGAVLMTAGERVLAWNGQKELSCFMAGQKEAWHVEWPYGEMVGSALVEGNTALVATRGGKIIQVQLEQGKIVGVTDVHEPLADGPLSAGKELLVVATFGSLLWLDRPRGEP